MVPSLSADLLYSFIFNSRTGACKRVLAASAALYGMACAQAAGPAQPLPMAQRTDTAPVIDGRLNDAVWQSAVPLSAFVQTRPSTGAVPSQRTELMLAHDGRTLFVAIRAFDTQPSAIIARNLRRDVEAIASDDSVTLVFDPQASGRNGFVFTVNALGAQRDGLVSDGSVSSFDFDTLWKSAARVDGSGWTAELAIPLAVFAAPAGSLPWGFNAERYIARSSERVRLYGIAADREVDTLADAEPLAGLPDALEQGRLNLRFRPSVRLTSLKDNIAANPARQTRLEPSLDVFWQPRPGLTGVLTLNSDFADTEVDQRQVNLTRFALFLPEKRAFFTQDAGRFGFGGLGGDEPDLLPFFSRRIGVDGAGRSRNLDAGVKLGGNLAGFDFGALAVQVEKPEQSTGPPETRAPRLGALRVARGLGPHQRVGVIATQGNPLGSSGSQLAGVDYQYRNTDLNDSGKTLVVNAFVQQSHNRDLAALGLDGRSGSAVGARMDYPNIGLIGNASVQRIDKNFLPALGFVNDTGIARSNGEIGWRHLTPAGDEVIPQIDWFVRRSLDGREKSRVLNPEIGLISAAGDELFPELYFEQDRLASGFEVVPGLFIPPGSYQWRWLGVGLFTSPTRELSGEAFVRSGGFYNGRRNDQFVVLNWRPSAHWGWGLSLDRNDITLPTGQFTVRNQSARLDYAASPRSSQSLVLQYDNVSRQWGTSLRGKWTLAPGREVLLALDRVRERALPGRPVSSDPFALDTTGVGSSPLRVTRATLKLVWALER